LTACSGTTSDLGRVSAACRPWPSLRPPRRLYPPCFLPASMYHCPVAQLISRTPLIKDFPSSAVWPGGSSTHVPSFIVVVQAPVCLAKAPTEGRDRGVSKKGGRPRGRASGRRRCLVLSTPPPPPPLEARPRLLAPVTFRTSLLQPGSQLHAHPLRPHALRQPSQQLRPFGQTFSVRPPNRPPCPLSPSVATRPFTRRRRPTGFSPSRGLPRLTASLPASVGPSLSSACPEKVGS
jgi:hypothetical protein